MNISTEAINAASRLKTFEQIRNGADTAKQLEALRAELQTFSQPIDLMAARATLLQTEGVELTPPTGIANSIRIIREISKRLTEAPVLTTLTQGSRWKNLTKNLEALKNEVATAQNNDWKRYFDHWTYWIPRFR